MASITLTVPIEEFLAGYPESEEGNIRKMLESYITTGDDPLAAAKDLEERIAAGTLKEDISSYRFDEELQELCERNYHKTLKAGKDGIFITWQQALDMFNMSDKGQAKSFRYIFHVQEERGCDDVSMREIDRYLSEASENGDNFNPGDYG